MTSPINSTSQLSAASNATAAAAASASTPTLGTDDFLKLLMAQLQNQDPLQPTDGTQFVTQLAQFTQVQQTVAQSTTLGNISTQIQGLSNANASNLVGKTVTVQGSGMQWNGTFATTANVTLAGAAQQVTVSIQDSQGNVVRTMKLGAEAGGTVPITWNGANDAGQPAPAGSYSVNVKAADASGQSVNVSQSVTGVVTQVSFDQGYPALTLNSGAVAPVSQLVSVGATPATP
ncbi:MAG TPA: FlgD immunoglobulin-like domain containing protein [Polyangiaceae bacterium]|nr:FlgD immunoglobulin-like domain containing protein [Polyangiaceae bacterium]